MISKESQFLTPVMTAQGSSRRKARSPTSLSCLPFAPTSARNLRGRSAHTSASALGRMSSSSTESLGPAISLSATSLHWYLITAQSHTQLQGNLVDSHVHRTLNDALHNNNETQLPVYRNTQLNTRQPLGVAWHAHLKLHRSKHFVR